MVPLDLGLRRDLFAAIGRVYVNGRFCEVGEAVVSVFDRGLIFGDGVYEVLPVYGGRPFRLDEHLDRLAASLAAVRIRDPMSREQWRATLRELAAGGSGVDRSVYLQVTRGVAPRDHAFPADAQPTVFGYVQDLRPMDPAILRDGVPVVVLPDVRWHRCDIKSTSLVANVLARQEALERGAAEALLARDGVVNEGSASNLFVVRDGSVVTPPKGPHMLPGITRDLVLELLDAARIPCREGLLREADLAAAAEIWITSSTREVVAVSRVDGRPVSGGGAGPLFARVYALYQQYKAEFRAGRVA